MKKRVKKKDLFPPTSTGGWPQLNWATKNGEKSWGEENGFVFQNNEEAEEREKKCKK